MLPRLKNPQNLDISTKRTPENPEWKISKIPDSGY